MFETPESRCYDKCRSGTIFLSKHTSISDDIHNTNKKDGEEKMLFDDMVLDWETCRDENKDFEEFFTTTEKYAAEELIDAKPVLPARLIVATGLDQHDSAEELLKAKQAFYTAVYRFAGGSIYQGQAKGEKGEFVYECRLDNVGLFRATLVIYLVALLYHITSGFPMILRTVFRSEEHKEMLAPIIEEAVCPMFKDIKGYEPVVLEE